LLSTGASRSIRRATGFFCRFDGPARAIVCAQRIVEHARELDLAVRAEVQGVPGIWQVFAVTDLGASS
jgi:hypothetical protein